MIVKVQALKLTAVINQLEACINAIYDTGDLDKWMSPDGISLLSTTVTNVQNRRLTLERIVNTPPSELETDFHEEDLKVQIEGYENLLFHFTGTLKLARERQEALSSR